MVIRLATRDFRYASKLLLDYPSVRFRCLTLELLAIEIMGHKETDPALIALLLEQCQAHGFSPFHVKQSSIGYMYNRYALTHL